MTKTQIIGTVVAMLEDPMMSESNKNKRAISAKKQAVVYGVLTKIVSLQTSLLSGGGMPGKRYVDMLLADLRPVEPLDSEARRELDELCLAQLRAKHGEDDLSIFCHSMDSYYRERGQYTTAELEHFREIEERHAEALAKRNARILARQHGELYWEEVLGMLVGAAMLFALLI